MGESTVIFAPLSTHMMQSIIHELSLNALFDAIDFRIHRSHRYSILMDITLVESTRFRLH